MAKRPESLNNTVSLRLFCFEAAKMCFFDFADPNHSQFTHALRPSLSHSGVLTFWTIFKWWRPYSWIICRDYRFSCDFNFFISSALGEAIFYSQSIRIRFQINELIFKFIPLSFGKKSFIAKIALLSDFYVRGRGGNKHWCRRCWMGELNK